LALALALLLVPAAASAQTGGVRVVIDGVSGRPRSNILSALSIAAAASEGSLSAERVRQLHERAPAEIGLALEPFGFYRPRIESDLAFERPRWIARYRIEPGPPLPVTRIDLQVRGDGSDDPQIREAAARFPLAEGQPLRHDQYEAGKLALAGRAADRGYLDATFARSEIRIDRAAYTAEIVLHLETGPRFNFGPVVFNQEILEPAVLVGYVTFQQGEPLDLSKLIELQAQLSAEPYFSRVEVEPRRDLAEALEVPIHVDMEPRKPQRYEVGVGYGTDTGPRASFHTEHRRINRRGHRASGEVRVSTIEQRVAARYLIPSRYPSTRVVSLFAGYAHLAPTASASDKIVVGASLGRTRGVWQETYSLTFEEEWFTVGVDEGRFGALMPTVAWSTTQADDRLNARRGHRVRFEIRGGHDAVLSDASFLQLKAHGKVILPLGRRARIIGRSDLGGIITDDFRRLPPTIRFFAGGDQNVRGFEYKSLGPRDEEGNVIGGEVVMVFSGELDYRFLGRWSVAAFYDTGNALHEFALSLEQSVGIGVRWTSPIGPVRVDGAFAVSRSSLPFRLHLAIGPDF
jgi:translocation and assembly module TamA